MRISPQYKAFIEELFESVGPIKIKSMFGGAGIFLPQPGPQKDIMFGLIARETVFLKADEHTRFRYEEEGMGPFTFGPEGQKRSMSYYQLPERFFDDPEDLEDWLAEAIDVALRTTKANSKKSR